MKHLPTLLLAALLTACAKDATRPVTLAATCEWCTVQYTVGGTTTTTAVQLQWNTTVDAPLGAPITLQACRTPSDLITTPDSTYYGDTLNLSLGVAIYTNGSHLARASATTTNGDPADPCAVLTYTVNR